MTKNKSKAITSGLAGVIAGAAAAATYILIIRPWHLRWGATEAELDLALPGDDLVPKPKLEATHAVTIHAPPGAVWPWLVQIGQGRGGFYSYDWLENLMGLDIHTVDEIRPELLDLKPGDVIPLAPDNSFSIPVAILEEEQALVLHGDTRTASPGETPPMKPGDYMAVRWGFYLEVRDDGKTRLVERWSADWGPGLANAFFYRLFLEPGAFIMQRKMLLGIKKRSEGWIS